MNNRFGIKDAVLLFLVLAVAIIGVLSMLQSDRVWSQQRRLIELLEEQSRTLAQVERRLATAESSPRPVVVSQGASTSQGSAAQVATHDDSWALPDIPIVRPEPYGMHNDPRHAEGFREGGTVTEIFEAQPPKITPYLYLDTYGRRVVELSCEFLAEFNPQTLELEGVLAEAWQYDPQGMWLRVKIHDRAAFSDGATVTAEDVRFTFHDIIMNPLLETARFKAVYGAIESVQVLSEKVAEFKFKEPRFNNRELALRFVILPRHFYENFEPAQFNQSTGLLMGSGPFRVKSLDPQWAPPGAIELVRNDRYWREAPVLDGLRFVVIQDPVARLTAFENGEGDMMRPGVEQYALKKADARFLEQNRILAWTNVRSGYAFIGWNCGARNGKPTPFSDKRVRLAMTHLLDRERVKRDIYEDLGVVATGPFHPDAEQDDPNIKPWPYDLDKAKSLLTEAGWTDRNGDGVIENAQGDPFRFQFTYAKGSESSRKLAAYLKDQCARVGIIVELDVIDWAILSTREKARDFDSVTRMWSPNDPESDPYQVWHSNAIKDQGDNSIQWRNAEADRLIEAGRRELDDTKRREIWHALHRLIHEEQPYTFVINPPWLRFIGDRLGNVRTYKMGYEPKEWFVSDPDRAVTPDAPTTRK